MKRVLLGIVIAVAAVVATVVGIGYGLPEAHTATVYADIGASRSDVWPLVAEPERAPEWRSSVDRVEGRPDTDGQPAWTEISSTGPMPMALVERVPEERLVTRILDEGMPFGGTWTIELADTPNGGTRVTITEDGRVYNPVFRFVSRFIMGHYGTAERYLRDLGSHFGEEIDPIRMAASDD
jgi:uncharacterized protein YndB with AHSA1/START domain